MGDGMSEVEEVTNVLGGGGDLFLQYVQLPTYCRDPGSGVTGYLRAHLQDLFLLRLTRRLRWYSLNRLPAPNYYEVVYTINTILGLL